MRIILFTGKGGVGKTTIAAATAIKAAAAGHKTLIISTDPAHSLSDALDKELQPEPVEVSENLYAQELDVYYSMKKYWGNIRQLMLTVFKWQGVKNVMAEEMSALPGMEEASAFLWIEKFFTEKQYDLIVIDSAPTGETLTLLTLPQVTKWWVTKALPLQKFAIRNVGRVARYTTGIPLDKGYEELENIFDKLETIQKIFGDPSISSIRIVTNAERMVINESKRAYTYLSLYGYNVDALIVNRLLQEEGSGSFFEQYYKTQQKYLREIEVSFSELPIFKAQHIGTEVFGTELLMKIADTIYRDDDPTTVFHQEVPIEVKENLNRYNVRVKLPLLEGEEFELNKFGDELVIQLHNRRQTIFLPRFVNFYQLKTYSFDAPYLNVELGK